MRMRQSETALANEVRDGARDYIDMGVDAYKAVSKQARVVGKRVDVYVHDYPWVAIGAAAGAGLLMGLLLKRRS